MEILQPWCRHMLLPPPRRECPFLCLPHFLPHIILSNCFLRSLLSPSCEGQRPVPPLSVSLCLSRAETVSSTLFLQHSIWPAEIPANCKLSMHLKCCYAVSKQFLLGFKILSILTSKILSLSLQIWLDSLLSLFPLTVFCFPPSSLIFLSRMSSLHVSEQIHWG